MWKAVRTNKVNAVSIDITYIENMEGGQNPMDINSDSSMGFHP